MRQMIYQELFHDTYLVVGRSCRCLDELYPLPRRQCDLPTNLTIYFSGHLPDVLTTSTDVRAEALHVFARSVTPFFCSTSASLLQQVPTYYLSTAPTAIVQYNCQIAHLVLIELMMNTLAYQTHTR